MSKNDKDNQNNKRCTFCDCIETIENRLITTKEDDKSICSSCIQATSIISEEFLNFQSYGDSESEDKTQKNTNESETNKLFPKDFKKILDSYVIGQERAKKVLSVGIFNHLKRIESLESLNSKVVLPKSNILILGPTGTGKTYLAETISSYLDIPMAIVNTTSLTASGYIGEDVSTVIERLWRNADEDVEKAQKGIIFLDEIDKNASSVGGTNDKDVSGKAVQQELLKLLEGDIINIYPDGTKNNRKSGDSIEISTKNILFIAGGAFPNIRKTPDKVIGFNKPIKGLENSNTYGEMQQLLEDFGIIPEFYGRFPNIVELEPLDIESLERIIKEPKNSIKSQYTELLKLYNIDVKFSSAFIKSIAEEAIKINTGARGLKTIFEDRLNDFMFESHKYIGKSISIGMTKGDIRISMRTKNNKKINNSEINAVA